MGLMVLTGGRIRSRPVDGDSAAAESGVVRSLNLVGASGTGSVPDAPHLKAASMNFVLQPWHLVLMILAGWVNREQQRVIE